MAGAAFLATIFWGEVQCESSAQSPHAHPVGDDHLLNLGSTLVNLGDFGVLHHALHGVGIVGEEAQYPNDTIAQ